MLWPPRRRCQLGGIGFNPFRVTDNLRLGTHLMLDVDSRISRVEQNESDIRTATRDWKQMKGPKRLERPDRTIRGVASALMMVVFASHVVAQKSYVPKLGSKAPCYVLNARTDSQQCVTGTEPMHRDPCTTVVIQKRRFTIAWDVATHEITYLFTDDPDLITDAELSVGGSCSLVTPDEKPIQMFHYMTWLITPAWTDMARDLSGDAVWFAALRRDAARPESGTIVGFVQSRYLSVGQ